MFKFDKDDFFNYLVATDQVDEFLGKKNEEKKYPAEEKNDDLEDELMELDDFDDGNEEE